MTGPQRIQQKRVKGWRKPDGAVSVARPSKWANPWRVWWDTRLQRWIVQADHNASSERFHTKPEAIAAAVKHFSTWAWRLDKDKIREALRGKDLMCYCPLDQPCHGDVLLEMANS